jgi:hypothetical protein
MIGLLKFWREGLIVVLLLALAGQQVRVAGEKSAHQKTKADHAAVLQGLADKTLKAYRAVVAEGEARQKAVAALDAQHTKELNDARTENSRLADAVRAGERRLRVNATCTPSTGTGVPKTPSAAGVAERDYFRLLDRIAESKQQVAGLQDYIRNVCLK